MWRSSRSLVTCLLCLLSGAAALGAVQRELDLETVGHAIMLGRSSDGARLHAAYRVAGQKPPIDYIEIVTPFRRILLAAQSRIASGARSLAQREALELLASAPDQMEVYVELTFHPLNTFVGVPAYAVVLVSSTGMVVEPRDLARVPRTGPRLGGLPPALPSMLGSQVALEGAPIAGGTIVAGFDLKAIDTAGTHDVLVRDGEMVIGRVAVDLGRLR